MKKIPKSDKNQIPTKVGIDPGLNGAIAFVNDYGIEVFDLPKIKCSWILPKKTKSGKLSHAHMIDTRKLCNWIKSCPYKIESITIEIVHSKHDQGIVSAFTFGGAFYSCISAVRCAGYEPLFVMPRFWKERCGLIGKSKDDSRLLVIRMYPGMIEKFARKMDVDRAEAVLIAVSR